MIGVRLTFCVSYIVSERFYSNWMRFCGQGGNGNVFQNVCFEYLPEIALHPWINVPLKWYIPEGNLFLTGQWYRISVWSKLSSMLIFILHLTIAVGQGMRVPSISRNNHYQQRQKQWQHVNVGLFPDCGSRQNGMETRFSFSICRGWPGGEGPTGG